MDYKFNEEMVKFKFRADEMMSHMVSEDKFKDALDKTVKLKDYEMMYSRVKELSHMVNSEIKSMLGDTCRIAFYFCSIAVLFIQHS